MIVKRRLGANNQHYWQKLSENWLQVGGNERAFATHTFDDEGRPMPPTAPRFQESKKIVPKGKIEQVVIPPNDLSYSATMDFTIPGWLNVYSGQPARVVVEVFLQSSLLAGATEFEASFEKLISATFDVGNVLDAASLSLAHAAIADAGHAAFVRMVAYGLLRTNFGNLKFSCALGLRQLQGYGNMDAATNWRVECQPVGLVNVPAAVFSDERRVSPILGKEWELV